MLYNIFAAPNFNKRKFKSPEITQQHSNADSVLLCDLMPKGGEGKKSI